MHKTIRWAIDELRDKGFRIDESHHGKIRVTHPRSDEVGWLNTTTPSERHARNFVRQLFRRHGVETEEDRSKRNNAAIKERRAQEAALNAERDKDMTADMDVSAEVLAASEARALTWHADHGHPPLKMSYHAAERALDMALTEEDIFTIYYDPKRAYISQKHDAWCLQRGKYALGIRLDADGTAACITVMYSTDKFYEKDQRKFGPLGRSGDAARAQAIQTRDDLPG